MHSTWGCASQTPCKARSRVGAYKLWPMGEIEPKVHAGGGRSFPRLQYMLLALLPFALGYMQNRWGYTDIGNMCVTALITGLPLYVMELVRTTSFQALCRIPLIVHFLVVDLYSLSTALDPVLIMRHSDFCLCLRDLFCCAKSILAPLTNHPQPQANSSSRSDPPEQSTTANISPV